MERENRAGAARREDLDEEDLRMALAGDDQSERREAASRLLARYRENVYEWCYRYVREHEKALDLAQDVLMSAYRNLHRFTPRAKFSTWLFVIARNRCVSQARSPAMKEVFGLDLDRIAGRNPDPERALEEKEARDRILRLMRDHLDRVEQDVVSLRCFERMPVESITKLMDIREASGARGVLQRARRKLRSALAGSEGD